MRAQSETPVDRGPGPFITHRVRRHPGGAIEVASSRRHRKGLRPHLVSEPGEADRPVPSQARAFRHLWAPGRLAWWIAVLFMVGSALFTVGGAAACWPMRAPGGLGDARVQGVLFAAGAVFFTAAAWLQWLEALNGDVAEGLRAAPPRRWRWLGWRPRNLGYLACAIQLVGTVMFNFDTLDALQAGLDRVRENVEVWVPDMVGCACFLVASYLAYAEVSRGAASLAPRSISWWIAVVNLVGSVAFQVSALWAFTGPGPPDAGALFRANFWTMAGGACFFAGAYLMIPELFDEAPLPAPRDAAGAASTPAA